MSQKKVSSFHPHKRSKQRQPLDLVWFAIVCCICTATLVLPVAIFAHGSVAFPKSRMYRVRFETNSAEILQQARNLDANPSDSYFTWNQDSLFIPAAAAGDMSNAFNYQPFIPDGTIASGNHRFDNWVKNGGVVDDGLDFTGLDIVSDQWPVTELKAGETFELDFLATAPHSPSVFDIWITTPDWDPNTELNWDQMQVIGEFWNRHGGGAPLPKYGDREFAEFVSDGPVDQGFPNHYFMDVTIPANYSGHHVLWIAWQRDDPAGEVFFASSDIMVSGVLLGDVNLDGAVNLLDVGPFIELLNTGDFQAEADINMDGAVNLLDVDPFIDLLGS